MKEYIKLCNYYKKIIHLQNLIAIIIWDMGTYMPGRCGLYRSDEISVLMDNINEMLTAKELNDKLSEIDESKLSNYQVANVRKIRIAHLEALSVDKKISTSLLKATVECDNMWRKYRATNDFKSLSPYLIKVVDLVQEMANARASYFNISSPYNALLDSYDTGSNTNEFDSICQKLEAFLPNFINIVIEKQKTQKGLNFGTKIFKESNQIKLSKYCMQSLGFDFSCGRLDKGIYPFCGGLPYDVRVVNRYDQNNFLIGLTSIMHETGHGLYEQNLPRKHINQPVGLACSASMHESQSLLMENYIGKSLHFIRFLQPKLLEILKIDNNSYTVDKIYAELNKVRRSFIRVNADELTYPIHIIIRYKLEKELISGNLLIDDLPFAWAEEMKKLLAIVPKDNGEGCMQDIHWSLGMFGYFPSYLKGAIIAGQIYSTLTKEIKDFNFKIGEGDFSELGYWLNSRIYSKGSLYKTNELIEFSTGNSIDLVYYKDYLQNKFLQH